MTSLLTLQDFVDYRGMSANINFNKDLKQHVLDAQEFELRIFMGDPFFLALVADFESGYPLNTYSDLFETHKYTYNSNEYESPGVKRLLVQYAHARYIAADGSTSTPYGYRDKRHDKSDKSDPKVIGRKSAKERSGATSYEGRIEKYLDRNKSIYPLWKCSHKKPTVGGGFKLTAIG
jgi:hypothetical protein